MEHTEKEERLGWYKLFYKHLNKNGMAYIIVPCSDNLSPEESKSVWEGTGVPPEIYYTSALLKRDLYITGFKNIQISKFPQCGGNISLIPGRKIDLVCGMGYKLK